MSLVVIRRTKMVTLGPEFQNLATEHFQSTDTTRAPVLVCAIKQAPKHQSTKAPKHRSTKHLSPSTKHQAPSTKRQQPSTKRQAPSTNHQTPTTKRQAPSAKRHHKKKDRTKTKPAKKQSIKAAANERAGEATKQGRKTVKEEGEAGQDDACKVSTNFGIRKARSAARCPLL